MAHLEMVSTIVHQLTRDLSMEEIEKSGLGPYYIDHGVGVWPQAAAGIPQNACEFQSKGDPITDLFEDLAADRKPVPPMTIFSVLSATFQRLPTQSASCGQERLFTSRDSVKRSEAYRNSLTPKTFTHSTLLLTRHAPPPAKSADKNSPDTPGSFLLDHICVYNFSIISNVYIAV